MPKDPHTGPADFPFRKFLRRSVDGPAMRWREILLLASIGFGAALALVLTVPALRKMEWRASTGRQAPVLVAAPEPPVSRTEEVDPIRDVSVLSPHALVGKVTFRARVVLEPPFDPLEAKVFKSETRFALLGGIEGPSATAICEDDAKALWACGLQARSALLSLIRLADVICEPFSVLDEAGMPRKGALVPSRCIARGKNVAVELVRAGFARPSGLPDRAMIDAEAEARLAERGLWRGNWRIIR